MSLREDMEKIGAAIGRALAADVERAGLADVVRDHYAAKYGRCRDCNASLGGPSPSKICAGCHAARALSRLDGDKHTGEA